MHEAHALCDLVRGLFVDELREQFVSIRESGSWSFASSNITIDGDKVACISGACLFQRLLEARITGGFLAVEHTELGQYHSGSGTDGCYLLACCKLVHDHLANTLVLEEIAGTRHTARQHDQVGISVVALLKLDISLDVHINLLFGFLTAKIQNNLDKRTIFRQNNRRTYFFVNMLICLIYFVLLLKKELSL